MGGGTSNHNLRPGWLRRPPGSQAVVFIHGFTGSADRTWGEQGKSWPELVLADDRFSTAGIFLCEYESNVDSGDYGFEEATRQVMTQLDVASTTGPRVTECDTILFVGHSAGGVISRNVLVHNLWAFRGKRVGLALVGSPSRGSDLADVGIIARNLLGKLPIVGPRLSVKGGKQLSQLTTKSSFLHALDAKFQFLIDNHFLTLIGREFIEHKPKFAGTPVVVKAESASVYYKAEAVMIATSNHSNICCPDTQDAQAHQELVRLWLQLLATSATEDEGVRQTEVKLRNEADSKLFQELQAIFSPDAAALWVDWIPGTSYKNAWLNPAWALEQRAKRQDCFFHDEQLQASHERHVTSLHAFTAAIASENETAFPGEGRVSKSGKGVTSATDPHKDRYDEALERVEEAQDAWISAYENYIKTFKQRLIL